MRNFGGPVIICAIVVSVLVFTAFIALDGAASKPLNFTRVAALVWRILLAFFCMALVQHASKENEPGRGYFASYVMYIVIMVGILAILSGSVNFAIALIVASGLLAALLKVQSKKRRRIDSGHDGIRGDLKGPPDDR